MQVATVGQPARPAFHMRPTHPLHPGQLRDAPRGSPPRFLHSLPYHDMCVGMPTHTYTVTHNYTRCSIPLVVPPSDVLGRDLLLSLRWWGAARPGRVGCCGTESCHSALTLPRRVASECTKMHQRWCGMPVSHSRISQYDHRPAKPDLGVAGNDVGRFVWPRPLIVPCARARVCGLPRSRA